MPRKDVMTKVPAAKLAEANDFMVSMFGDPPGSQEISLNAYVDGQISTVGTHSLCVANCSQAQANSLAAYMGQTEGCASAAYPVGSGDYWAKAFDLWGLKPVDPVVP